jgi:hypothetical protein
MNREQLLDLRLSALTHRHVEQLVARLPHKQKVPGSSPGVATTF